MATLDTLVRPLDFAGASVVLTGGDRGIGRGIADAFARAGADVLIVSDAEAVHATAAALADAHGVTVRGVVADVTDGAALHRALAGVRAIDVLVSNAGIELRTPLDDADPVLSTAFRRVLDVNVTGCENLVRAALPALADGGRILVTSSIWGKTSVAGFSAYAASKHALIGLVRTWARELGGHGITVNAVCPGWVRTEAAMRSLAAMAAEAGRDEADLLAEIVGAQALDGLMEPADVAGTYLFLASTLAGSITGQAITVDRGEILA